MPMLETLRRSGGLEAIAVDVDISPSESVAAAKALLPPLLEGFRQCKHRTRDSGGLIALLERHGGYGLASNVLGPEPVEAERGEQLLREVLGDQAFAQVVATHASMQTGIEVAEINKVLPRLAMLLAGYLAARASSGQGDPEQELERILTKAQNMADGGAAPQSEPDTGDA